MSASSSTSATYPSTPVLGWGRTDDPFATAMRTGRGPLWLRTEDGRERIPLHVERWCAEPDRADSTMVDRALRRGLPTLDIGCGPGRLVTALQRRGLPALGVDVTPAAVTRTVGLGGSALCRSVFDRLPGEGRWGTGLLADGNLGIGGDPSALLGRVAGLLAPGGRLLVEVEPVEVDERLTVRLEDGAGRLGPTFPWARLGTAATVRIAEAAGFTPTGGWHTDGRVFLDLLVPHA
ncbi:class I SAM-dependent methyltransferase [Streptacidiphilus melanogenes]|uniref:class I SAM-dependent methyltransferase n=1 Tax=Streptacidiphilus melanogenes TaxID=411235 RepID=UPI000A5784AB|nr:methionine biosynthesis protein MetW [Streptacidiphilus melanogenes]